MKYQLTKKGHARVTQFLAECNAKRKEILDAEKDTAEETNLPTEEDILCDIENFIDEDGEYFNGWGVTDHYDSDTPIALILGIDFIESTQDEMLKHFNIEWEEDETAEDISEKIEALVNEYENKFDCCGYGKEELFEFQSLTTLLEEIKEMIERV